MSSTENDQKSLKANPFQVPIQIPSSGETSSSQSSETSDESILEYSFDIAPPGISQAEWTKYKVDNIIDNIAKLNTATHPPHPPTAPVKLMELVRVESQIVAKEHQKNIERIRDFQMEIPRSFDFNPLYPGQGEYCYERQRETFNQSFVPDFVEPPLEHLPFAVTSPNVMLPPAFEDLAVTSRNPMYPLRSHFEAPPVLENQNDWFDTVSNILAPDVPSSQGWISSLSNVLPSSSTAFGWFSKQKSDGMTKVSFDILSSVEAGEMTEESGRYADDEGQVVIQMPADVEQGWGARETDEPGPSLIGQLIPTEAMNVLENVGNASASYADKFRKKFKSLWFINRLADPVDERPDQRV